MAPPLLLPSADATPWCCCRWWCCRGVQPATRWGCGECGWHGQWRAPTDASSMQLCSDHRCRVQDPCKLGYCPAVPCCPIWVASHVALRGSSTFTHALPDCPAAPQTRQRSRGTGGPAGVPTALLRSLDRVPQAHNKLVQHPAMAEHQGDIHYAEVGEPLLPALAIGHAGCLTLHAPPRTDCDVGQGSLHHLRRSVPDAVAAAAACRQPTGCLQPPALISLPGTFLSVAGLPTSAAGGRQPPAGQPAGRLPENRGRG